MSGLKEGNGRAQADEAEIAYLVRGQGPPVAATHPYMIAKDGYGVPGISDVPGCSTITVWPRGFGDSSPPRDDQDLGIWRLVDDLEAVRTHLGLTEWGFWGVSMGGFVGLEYALAHPLSLTLLILDSTAASYHYGEDPETIWPALRSTPEAEAFYMNPGPETILPFFIRMWELMGAPDAEAMMRDWMKRMEFNTDALQAIMRRLHEYDTRARLGTIEIPTLVLAGGLDRGCPPSHNKIIADGIPGAVLKIYEEAGHGVLYQRYTSAADDVAAFIERTIGGSE